MRVGTFVRACEAKKAATHQPFLSPGDDPAYQAPERTFSFASDMFSVGAILFEMATGKLPSLRLDRDKLLSSIDDPSKRELISFALHDDPSKRPTAEELLQKITQLAPLAMLESQFRAQVFASMRFGDIGPMAEAKVLRGKLASQGVHLHIVSVLPGQSITTTVFETMAKCDAFIAMATKDYGEDTGNPAATFHEVRVWREQHTPKPLIPLRMVHHCARPSFPIGSRILLLFGSQIPWSDTYDHEAARSLFSANLLALTWIKGEPLPDGLVDDVLRGLGIARLGGL